MKKQRTLKNEFSLSGTGLHTGCEVSLTFRPAPANHGYKIRRTDLSGQPVIPANAMYTGFTDRRTVLAINDIIQVSTVEHGLAALYACEIDNCLIDVDAPEFPAMDGSALAYVNNIKAVGVVEQDEERIYYEPGDIVEYVDGQSGSHLILLPSDTFGIHIQILFDSAVLSVQSASLSCLSNFADEIAMCRTFVFIREIEPLLKKGLIKGGSLDNAIVIYDKMLHQRRLDELAYLMNAESRSAHDLGYIVNQPLRFPNEPARHKLLDLVGDIALTGKFIKGLIIAVCPGHQVNNAFARTILRKMKKEICLLSESESLSYG